MSIAWLRLTTTTGHHPKGDATRAACSVARASSVRWMVEARCITTKRRVAGGGSPLHYPARRGPRLGLCLTMATHYDHATNMSITSQHVSIVEKWWAAIALPEWGFQAWLYPRTMATRHGHYVYVD